MPGLAVGARTRMYDVRQRPLHLLRPGRAPRARRRRRGRGIARLEFPAVGGLDAVVDRGRRCSPASLPRYAGVAHRDPRAPVNLTPVKNLERHLTRLLGPVKLATPRRARRRRSPERSA